MRVRSLVPLVFACLLPLSCHADVLYEWTPLNNEVPRDFKLQLVLTDDAVAAGHAAFHLVSGSTVPEYQGGLLSLTLDLGEFPLLQYIAGEQTGSSKWGELHLSANVTSNGDVLASILANDTSTNFSISAGGDMMTITEFRSDHGLFVAGCDWDQSQCNGATGIMRRVGLVPEPASLGLLGAGILGFLVTRVKRSGAKTIDAAEPCVGKQAG